MHDGSRRHADADVLWDFGFVRKKTAHAGDINGEKSSQRRSPFFVLFLCGWGEYILVGVKASRLDLQNHRHSNAAALTNAKRSPCFAEPGRSSLFLRLL